MELVVDDKGADDQDDRRRKLKDHKNASESPRLQAGSHLPLQHIDRSKCRDKEGWIAPRQESCDNRNSQYDKDHRNLA